MSFPRYPRYKDSGVEWLGDVPEHWEVGTIKRLSRKITDGAHISPEVENGVHAFVSTKDIAGEAIDFDNCLRTSASSYDLMVRTGCRPEKGDVLFSKDGTIGRTVVVREDDEFVVASSLIIIRPETNVLDSNYLHRLCQSTMVTNQVDAFVKGAGLPRLSVTNLTRVVGCFPPLTEQRWIAAFLDREVKKIDVLIAEQQRLIDLLKEKGQTVISHAVTRGLNPDAPMKPSGVEWLGDVPEHWEVTRLANLFREIAESGTDELPVLSVSIHDGVSDRELDENEMDRKVSRSEDRSKYKRVAPADLVYNMMRAWQGGFGTVSVEGMVSPAYVVARPRTPIATRYVEHLLRTPQAIEQMRRHSRGVTDFRLRLYWEEFKNIRVSLPPRDEAARICEAIAAMETEFSALTAEAECAITLLQERRTALISAAVTGKIDVRGLAEAA